MGASGGKGIPSYQSYHGLATDGDGNVYISAQGPGNAVWFEKYSPGGALSWRRTPGTPKYDETNGLAVDSSGNVLISGITFGSLGGPNIGSGDAWLARYSREGVINLRKQFGTRRYDGSVDLSIDDHDNIYLLGFSLRKTDSRQETWINKYSQGGVSVWRKKLGSSMPNGEELELNVAGDIITAGETFHYPADVWVSKFSPSGHTLWTSRFGTRNGHDQVTGLETDDEGNVFIGGQAFGLSSFAAWIAKLSPEGGLLWTRHDTRANNYAADLAVDQQGNAYLLGSTYEYPPGISHPWL